MSELARGWSLRPLGELVSAQRTQRQPEDIAPETPYVGLEHVESGTGLHTFQRAGEAGLRSSKFEFLERDLLFGKLRPNLRKVAVAACAGVCSTDLIPLRPRDPEDAELLAFQLRSPDMARHIERLVAGASLPRVNVKDLLGIPIPVPPAEERESIRRLARLLAASQREAAILALRLGELQEAAANRLLGRLLSQPPRAGRRSARRTPSKNAQRDLF